MLNSIDRPGRSPSKKGVRTAIVVLGVLGVGLSVPLLSGTASAAPISSWDRIAACESDGQWYLPYGDADSTGGLQIQDRTWNEYKSGVTSVSHAYQASKQQQIMVAEKILADPQQGYGNAWVCNSMTGYPLSSSGPNASYLRGGINPYASTPAPTPTPVPTPTPTPVPTTGDKYTVKSGDSLYSIALAQKISGGWQALYAANKTVVGSNPTLIFPGQKLTLPRPVVKYTVKKGDTLSGIATALKVQGGWKQLYAMNKAVIGSNPDLIQPGMVLVVSGVVGTPSTPSTPKPPTTPSSQGWVTPTEVMNITQGFRNPGNYGLGYHTGIDITRPQGTPVRAIANATVMHAGYGYAGSAYGLHVVLKLPDGRYALYGHLSATTVRTGQSVSAGQMVGNVGSTGNSSGPHLHFEIRTSPDQYAEGVFLDPVTYLRSHGVTV